MSRELRSYKSALKIERRMHEGKEILSLRGTAAVFNQLSDPIMGFFRERIMPGAFDGVMEDDVRALFNHDYNLVLGRSAAKTLKYGVDENGLWYEVDLPDTEYARNLAHSIERGDIDKSSFSFSIERGGDKWLQDPEDLSMEIREVNRIERLFDVSPVTIPAYPQTSVQVSARSISHASRGESKNPKLIETLIAARTNNETSREDVIEALMMVSDGLSFDDMKDWIENGNEKRVISFAPFAEILKVSEERAKLAFKELRKDSKGDEAPADDSEFADLKSKLSDMEERIFLLENQLEAQAQLQLLEGDGK
jgi:uncharacterized protein